MIVMMTMEWQVETGQSFAGGNKTMLARSMMLVSKHNS